MNIQIHARNLNLNDRTQTYIENKLNRLDRYLPTIDTISADVTFHHHAEGDQATVQLTVRDKRGTILRAEEKDAADAISAVDAAVSKIHRQISRYKDKYRRRAGHDFERLEPELAAAESMPDHETSEADSINGGIVRRKELSLMPMSEQDAIDQMELLSHSFFVFYNAETAQINVLYKRAHGDYGVLIPKAE